jgi:hypothetical protein
MKNWLITGSVAMHHWYPGEVRDPGDIDLLTPAKITGNHSQVCVVDASWHDAAEYLLRENRDPVFLDADLLFTLKVSHAHWDIKWDKTMYDIAFLKSKDCRLNYLAYDKLFEVWTAVHGKKRVNMNKPMTEFFKDSVRREYDHEELHRLVAFNPAPMHELLRTDHSTAWCSQELFDHMTREQQFQTCLEEIMATAIERSRLKASDKRSTKLAAMSKAHKQLVTSMTTGWFARFLILNHRELLSPLWREQWEPRLNSALQKLPS